MQPSNDHPLAPTPAPKEPNQEPPRHIVRNAIEAAQLSPCQSRRGAVIFRGFNIYSRGYNHKPKGFECDGSNGCKTTCRVEAVHAEQAALVFAPEPVQGSDMLHVKVVDGKLVPSGPPSCVQCSKLAIAAGIKWFWLYHESGWKRYDMHEFHRLSLLAEPTPALPSEGRIDCAAENFIRAASEYFVHSELHIDVPISYSMMFLKARKELRQALAAPAQTPARTATAEPEQLPSAKEMLGIVKDESRSPEERVAHHDARDLGVMIDEANAEIERLKAEVSTLLQAAEALKQELDDARACPSLMCPYKARVKKAEAEVAHLTAALQEAQQPEAVVVAVATAMRERWIERATFYKAEAPKQCCLEAAHDFVVVAETARRTSKG